MTWFRQTETYELALLADYTILLEARRVGLRWPGGGWVWKHPRRVHVSHAGVTHVYPVVDRTRRLQIIIILLGLALSQAVSQSARKTP